MTHKSESALEDTAGRNEEVMTGDDRASFLPSVYKEKKFILV